MPRRSLFALLTLLWCLPAAAEDEALARLFAERGVEGTLVMVSRNGGEIFIHNDARADTRFPTASTFKVLNTLIALEEGAIAGKDDVLVWDGQVHDFADWNRDQTLASAFKVSCVWCYQVLARRVGADRYRTYLRDLEYGHLTEPFDGTTFWLDGALTISAVEQAGFLQRVQQRTLPFRAHAFDTLRDIMLARQTPGYALWGKTGWAARVAPQVGWYVGYVETPQDVWVFAMNIDVHDPQDLPLRQALTLAALRAKGVIDGSDAAP
jgi:beta-lactamase class D